MAFDVDPYTKFRHLVMTNAEKVILGKDSEIEKILVSLLCRGHVLLDDVPGTGKTMLARTMAASIGGVFRRIQFTPDLLPNDVTGVTIFNQKTTEFEFRPGPVFANVLLADEINRATPRTQSALLEAMSESQVSFDGVARSLPTPFTVLATQNPVEFEGTFPLPEAQLDRFMMRLTIGYPGIEEEREILESQRHGHPIDNVEAVTSLELLTRLQDGLGNVHVDSTVTDYLLRLVRATRERPELSLGASPRGSLALYKASQALAALRGRDFVLPDDVKELAPTILAHRLLVAPEYGLRGITSDGIVTSLVESVELQLVDADGG